jgi:hypothetical protein
MSMYCPRCTKEFDLGTAYCRTCGLPLDQITAIVNGERDSEPATRTSPNRSLMQYGMGCFVLGIVIALGTALVKDLGLFPEAIGKYVFLFLAMVGTLLLGLGVVFPQKKYVKRKNRQTQVEKSGEILATSNLDRLPSADRNIDDLSALANDRKPDSVTENTTRRLL